MSDGPLLQFRSHVAGHNADVRILPTRVEWLVAGRRHVTEAIPITAITSVSSSTAGFVRWKVVVATNEKTVEFRVTRATARSAAALLSQLIDHLPRRTKIAPQLRGTGSFADELINLKWLFDNGILTEHDFERLRARLLGL